MTSIKTIAVAALLSMMAAAPALAQEAIQEPGAFAFYYPNLDVLNGGADAGLLDGRHAAFGDAKL